MRIVLMAVLIVFIGGFFSGCSATDALGKKLIEFGAEKGEDVLKDMEEKKYKELEAYLSLKGMTIKDLDTNNDGAITAKELTALPGLIMMNPSTAGDGDFWLLLMSLLGATYGHRGIRKYRDGKKAA